MLRRILLTIVFLMVTSVAAGEYYRYIDENGNISFTDDLTLVPENQRDSLESFKTETGGKGKTASKDARVDQGSVTASLEDGFQEEYGTSTGDTFEIRAGELNRIQAELNRTRQSLEKARKELEARVPGPDAPNSEKIIYRSNIEALNTRIENYRNDLKNFENKVTAFQNRGRSEAE
jgi:HAMP domain-containing protein